jgi:hypothetical protein
MELNDFAKLDIGDIITLSDIQTQKEYNSLQSDFIIKEVRRYNEPGGLFNHIGLICDYENKSGNENAPDQTIMILVRNFKSINTWDIFVYYLDTDGDISNFYPVLNETGEDLIDQFEVTLHFADADIDVTWFKKEMGTVFGVESESIQGKSHQDKNTDCKTIAEYFTNDDTRGNPHCFIEWTGDSGVGYIEIWYGCEITPSDIEVYNIINN